MISGYRWTMDGFLDGWTGLMNPAILQLMPMIGNVN